MYPILTWIHSFIVSFFGAFFKLTNFIRKLGSWVTMDFWNKLDHFDYGLEAKIEETYQNYIVVLDSIWWDIFYQFLKWIFVITFHLIKSLYWCFRTFLQFFYKCGKSVTGCMGYLMFCNWFITMILFSCLNSLFPIYIKYNIFSICAIFCILWMSYSLIALPAPAKMANEIISGISAFLFTAGTAIIGMYSNQELRNALASLELKEQDLNDFIQEINKNGYNLNQLFQAFLLPLLFFIGISTLSVILINLKLYWENKYPLPERVKGDMEKENVL